MSNATATATATATLLFFQGYGSPLTLDEEGEYPFGDTGVLYCIEPQKIKIGANAPTQEGDDFHFLMGGTPHFFMVD